MSTKKKIVNFFKLHLPAQKATPAPPVGPTLGQYGVNIADFCKRFNDKSKSFATGAPIPVSVVVYKDKSYDFKLGNPTVSYMIKKFIKDDGGTKVISKEDLESVAKSKIPDLSCTSLEKAYKTVAGSAKSMNVKIV